MACFGTVAQMFVLTQFPNTWVYLITHFVYMNPTSLKEEMIFKMYTLRNFKWYNFTQLLCMHFFHMWMVVLNLEVCY